MWILNYRLWMVDCTRYSYIFPDEWRAYGFHELIFCFFLFHQLQILLISSGKAKQIRVSQKYYDGISVGLHFDFKRFNGSQKVV